MYNNAIYDYMLKHIILMAMKWDRRLTLRYSLVPYPRHLLYGEGVGIHHIPEDTVSIFCGLGIMEIY